ncbi:MAG: hypothetical protein ACTIA9_05800, partial [Enterococcus faecalis]
GTDILARIYGFIFHRAKNEFDSHHVYHSAKLFVLFKINNPFVPLSNKTGNSGTDILARIYGFIFHRAKNEFDSHHVYHSAKLFVLFKINNPFVPLSNKTGNSGTDILARIYGFIFHRAKKIFLDSGLFRKRFIIFFRK